MPSSSAAFRLFDKTTDWFERARAALLGELPCRQGCHRCCIGLFPVTLLDQQVIQQGLRSLTDERRQAMTQKASHQADRISAAVPRLTENPFIDDWSDQDVDALVEQYRDLPCPALQSDGSCGIYAFRPLTCRSMGIPSDEREVVQGACDVQIALPLIRLSKSLRLEEERLARTEAEQLTRLRRRISADGEEIFLPHAFLPWNSPTD